jgi:superfamily I DNA/RNA helicase
MIHLNEQQKVAVEYLGNAVVTACPGSGKTRILTYRVIRGLEQLTSTKHRVIAMTFTNRATDEIQSRLDQFSINHKQLWAGTIHAFALEWILRPYAPYIPRLQKGFSIADEFLTERLLKELRKESDQPPYFEINTSRDRNGHVANNEIATNIFQAYQTCLQNNKLLDYDDVLYYTYRLLADFSEISQTLGSIIRLFCVDEIQDTQDLQYGIISAIFKASSDPPTLFFVGDSDQSIYESLGAVIKSVDEIAEEFGLESIEHLGLTGNYRSTQRIIDFYQCFRPRNPRIQSLTSYATERGMVAFHDQTVAKDNLPDIIARLIRESVESGVLQSEICVLAPHWWHVRALGRSLVRHLPDIDFDAPGLSPLHCQRENFWFKVSRLFLTTPSPSLYGTRFRWAREVIRDLEDVYGIGLHEIFQKSRSLLRLVNSITSSTSDGLIYLDEVFNTFMETLGIDVNSNEGLSESHELFFEKARARIEEIGENAPADIHSFKKLFKHPSGVVISTCHGIKGEEYHTVIAFGLLNGYIPNWRVIIHGDPETADDRASKLLYVICSRAKKRLHLIAESGRFTQNNNEYETTPLLRSIEFDYDPTLDTQL